jgi:formamidopyrimidine-DNA glycosylase
MPELPEVETLCRQLCGVVIGEHIQDVRILDLKLGSPPEVTGRKVVSVARSGKGIGMALDDQRVIRLHLRMTGRLLWQDDPDSISTPDYARLTLIFTHGRLDLIDPRRFATLHMTGPETPPIPPDPIEDFDSKRLKRIAGSRTISIKSFLLDQRVIAGIGNIYACEILHEAKIHPAQRACDVTAAQWRRLAKVAAPMLTKAVDCRGTTVSDWRDLFGKPGEYQHHLKVYAKAGLRCPRCLHPLSRIAMGGRGTYFCSSCQR